jgi:hypothetical protein
MKTKNQRQGFYILLILCAALIFIADQALTLINLL